MFAQGVENKNVSAECWVTFYAFHCICISGTGEAAVTAASSRVINHCLILQLLDCCYFLAESFQNIHEPRLMRGNGRSVTKVSLIKKMLKRVRTFAEASSEQDILSAELASFFLAELALESQSVPT
jgi:hypothetical protein